MQEIQEMQVQFLGQDIPWSRKWQLTPVFLPGTSHRQRSLVSYSPQSHKESYTTERLSIHTYTQKCLPFGKHHKILIIIITCLHPLWASMVAHGKESANAGDVGLIPGLGRSPEERNGTHSNILVWETPWTEEPGRLQSMGSPSQTRLCD